MAIYCREEYNEKVSIKRIRQLRTKILNKLFNSQDNPESDDDNNVKEQIKESNQLMQAPNRTALK
jgi:hypothetical protein